MTRGLAGCRRRFGPWDGARAAFEPLLVGVPAGDPREKTIRDLIDAIEKKRETAGKEKDEHPKPEEIAVNVERPRSTPRGTVVLRGAKIVTMKGDEVIAEGFRNRSCGGGIEDDIEEFRHV